MNNRSDLKIIDTVPVPENGVAVVLAEIDGSPPGIGMRYEDASSGVLWEVVGFATAPAGNAFLLTRLNLMLRKVGGDGSLTSGSALVWRERKAEDAHK